MFLGGNYMKQFLAVFLVFIASLSAMGENYPEHERKPVPSNGENNGIGVGGTVWLTQGFVYRHHFHNGLGFSTSIGGFANSYGGYIGNALGLLYPLGHYHPSWSWLESIRVYAVGYLANIYNKNNRLGHDYSSTNTYRAASGFDIGLGVGPGVEFFFNRHFSFHAEVPWMVFGRIANKSFSFRDTDPHPGIGLVYYF
jgi:hypothetical protein